MNCETTSPRNIPIVAQMSNMKHTDGSADSEQIVTEALWRKHKGVLSGFLLFSDFSQKQAQEFSQGFPKSEIVCLLRKNSSKQIN